MTATPVIPEESKLCPDCNSSNRGIAHICYNCGFTFVKLEKIDSYRKLIKKEARKVTSKEMEELMENTDILYKKLRELNHKDPDLFSDWGKRVYLFIKLFKDSMKGNFKYSRDFLKSIAFVLKGFLKPTGFIWNLFSFKLYEEKILGVSILWFDKKEEIEKYLFFKGEKAEVY